MTNAVTLSIIITQTLIAVYLFNTLKLKNHFEKYLNALLVIFFFHLGTKLFLLVGLKNTFLYNNNASGFGLSYGPLLYIITYNYMRKPLPRTSILIHMLPFVICTLIYFISCAGYLGHILTPAFIISYSSGYQWVIMASMVIYPALCLQKLKQHAIAADAKAINPPAKLLRQLAVIMLAGIGAGVVVALYYVVKTGNQAFDLRVIIYTFLAAMPVLILRYKMQSLGADTLMAKQTIAEAFVKQMAIEPAGKAINIIAPPVNAVVTAVQTEQMQTEESGSIANITEKRYTKSGVDNKMMDKYEVAVKQFMEKTKIYLEPEISLDQLAAKANIPKHHITQLLNERFGKNFYAFINEHRIAEAMERLKTDRNLNILSLAYDCGFNSKSSFNTYFKKVTGVTPSVYRKEHNPHQIAETDHMA